MHTLDLAFALQAQKLIPADHGYAVYGAVSRMVSEVHAENGVGIHPICGRQVGDRRLMLMPWSSLTFRVPDGQIAPLLRLAGKLLRLSDATLRVGVPQVRALTPASALRSRLVVIKVKDTKATDLDTDTFTTSARRQLDEMGISNEAILTAGKRRTLRIKHREIVGYEVLVEGLTVEESLTLQEQGLGGRRHMGCGVFVPVALRKDDKR